MRKRDGKTESSQWPTHNEGVPFEGDLEAETNRKTVQGQCRGLDTDFCRQKSLQQFWLYDDRPAGRVHNVQFALFPYILPVTRDLLHCDSSSMKLAQISGDVPHA